MRLTARVAVLAAMGSLCVALLAGCAALVPSASSGTSEASFGALGELPLRVSIRSAGIPQHDPVGDVLRAELPALGFTIVEHEPQGLVTAEVGYSDFSPVRLELSLSDLRTGTILWSARIVRAYDVYASVVSASESNARKAMELLRRDLAAAEANRLRLGTE